MGRKRHWHFPHAMYHVILRGNNRHDIFLDNQEREQFLLFLENGIKKFACKLHAFCLMTNHVHLAIGIDTLPLGKIMQNVAHSYACWFNRRHQRVGHVFQGRYRAVLVQNERYMLELCRYIHLNPLKAKIVPSLEQYRWSSHLTYLGKQAVSWVYTDLVFSILVQNQTILDKVDAYKQFVSSADSAEQRHLFLEVNSTGRLIGCDQVLSHLHQEMAKLHKTPIELPHIIEVVCRKLSIDERVLSAEGKNWRGSFARAIIALCFQEVGDKKIGELAMIFNRSAAALSNSLSRLRQRRWADPVLDSVISTILKELTSE